MAKSIKAYVIEFLEGRIPKSVTVLPNQFGDVMTGLYPGSRLMVGILPEGGVVHIPMGAIFNVFATEYKVTMMHNGKFHETKRMDENHIADNADKIRRVSTLDGEEVYRAPNPLDKPAAGGTTNSNSGKSSQ